MAVFARREAIKRGLPAGSGAEPDHRRPAQLEDRHLVALERALAGVAAVGPRGRQAPRLAAGVACHPGLDQLGIEHRS